MCKKLFGLRCLVHETAINGQTNELHVVSSRQTKAVVLEKLSPAIRDT